MDLEKWQLQGRCKATTSATLKHTPSSTALTGSMRGGLVGYFSWCCMNLPPVLAAHLIPIFLCEICGQRLTEIEAIGVAEDDGTVIEMFEQPVKVCEECVDRIKEQYL